MPSSKVLIVDADSVHAEAAAEALQARGFEVVTGARGDRAYRQFGVHQPDVIILGLELPGLSGLTVCNQIRSQSNVPIIMCATATTAQIVAGLNAGADDFMRKPVALSELVARVQARLRPATLDSPEVAIGDLLINTDAHSVTRGGAEIALTPLEFDLLLALARRPWRVFTRAELLTDVWGYRDAGDTRLVNVHVQRLRAKVEPDPDRPTYVLTVRGVGYRAGGQAPG